MLQRAGVRLQNARETRGLTIEDAARATRIRPQQLRDLENDDYGNFPNPTYAKSFLTQYARYLEVDVSQERETFDVSHAHTYSTISNNIFPRAEHVTASLGDRERPRSSRTLIPIALMGLVILGLMALFMFKIMQDINRSAAAPEAPPPQTAPAPQKADAVPRPTRAQTQPPEPPREIVAAAQPVRPPAQSGHVEVRRAIPVDATREDATPEEEPIRRSNPAHP